MQQVVYGDVLFLVNFSVDFLVLFMAGCFLHLKRRPFRLVLAALVGGIYGVVILLPALSWWGTLFIHFLTAFCLCLIAYSPVGRRMFFSLFLSFFGAALLLGGVLTAFYGFLATVFETGSTNAVTSSKKAELFLLYAAISALVIFVGGRALAKRKSRKEIMVEVWEGEKSITVCGLVDSGNLLTDPLSGKPVILVRRQDVLPIIPSDALTSLERGTDENRLPLHLRRKIRVILAQGAVGQQVLFGYLPDDIFLYGRDREKNKYAVDAILAVAAHDTKDFAGYGGIVPASLC
ncbi:MAG: sigma-E processing peptidase SpoIIGA [Clostridia bacterium]|nr:sigma-E processing peptidase SpoIIGA [Clostridia bacterium]